MRQVQVSRQVTIGEAATILGIGVQAVRRRIRAGTLRSDRVERPQGYVYLVTLPGEHVSTGDHVPTGDEVSTPDDISRQVPTRPTGATRAPRDSVAHALIEDLRQARERIDQLEQERFELAGRLGFYQAGLAHMRALVAPAEPPATAEEPVIVAASPIITDVPAEVPASRPWWRVWR